MTIRSATPADVPTILALVIELAVFEREPDAVHATEASLTDALFGPKAVAECLIAEDAGTVTGIALFFTNFSTWSGKPGLYLEDLYVTPAARGGGTGKALLAHLAALAVARGYARVEWSVLDWNAPAIGFYESIGAKPQSDWTVYRLQGDALTKLAAS